MYFLKVLSAYKYTKTDNENGIPFVATFVLSNITFTFSLYWQTVNFAISGSSMTVKIIPDLVLLFQRVPYCHSALQFGDRNRQQQPSNWMQQLWCSMWGEDIVQKGNFQAIQGFGRKQLTRKIVPSVEGKKLQIEHIGIMCLKILSFLEVSKYFLQYQKKSVRLPAVTLCGLC